MVGAPRILNDGTIVYPHRGNKKPPCLEGYKRKSEEGPNAWILIPLWRGCRFRQQTIQRREDCKCEVILHVCNHPQLKGTVLSVSVCEKCLLCQTD
jgi:hypothetical protein